MLAFHTTDNDSAPQDRLCDAHSLLRVAHNPSSGYAHDMPAVWQHVWPGHQGVWHIHARGGDSQPYGPGSILAGNAYRVQSVYTDPWLLGCFDGPLAIVSSAVWRNAHDKHDNTGAIHQDESGLYKTG